MTSDIQLRPGGIRLGKTSVRKKQFGDNAVAGWRRDLNGVERD